MRYYWVVYAGLLNDSYDPDLMDSGPDEFYPTVSRALSKAKKVIGRYYDLTYPQDFTVDIFRGIKEQLSNRELKPVLTKKYKSMLGRLFEVE